MGRINTFEVHIFYLSLIIINHFSLSLSHKAESNDGHEGFKTATKDFERAIGNDYEFKLQNFKAEDIKKYERRIRDNQGQARQAVLHGRKRINQCKRTEKHAANPWVPWSRCQTIDLRLQHFERD